LVLISRGSFGPLPLVGALSAAFGALAQTAATDTLSIRDGVFTAEQAQRGRIAYTGPRSPPRFKLDGASTIPTCCRHRLSRAKFLRKWNGRTLAALLDYVRVTMPANNPGCLSAEVADIVAYMLSVSGTPEGSETLQPDLEALARIVIEPLSD
jgi:hypothetical protein